MDPRVASVLDDLRADAVADTAALMSVLVRSIRPRRMLELGGANGYCTVWLAEALRAVGGRLVSVELDPRASLAADANLSRAGLSPIVELRIQDAGVTLARSPDACWDMVFLDAERPAYPGYWPDLVRALAPAGLLVVDHVLSHADELAEFRATVSRDARVTDAVVPTGAGALLVVRNPRRG